MPRKKTTAKTTAKRKTTTKKSVNKTAAKKITMKLQQPEEISQEVRQYAYDMYIKKGGWHGGDLSDWLEAEKKVKEKHCMV
ncbi:MAG: DUF2934 domain-containing protein [candidate division Zixibacteria bacterium]|nr:DUF2934 domain-containing protein [candidate division Zixibacteria bacterium]